MGQLAETRTGLRGPKKIALVLSLAALLVLPSMALADETTSESAGSDMDTVREDNEIGDGPFEGVVETEVGDEPPGITGDWGGSRSWLSERGVVFSADVTQTYQGIMDGGYDDESAYLGSSELILDLDTEKLGLWPGGFGRVAAEGRFGNDVIGDVGSFSPVNNDALFPADPDREGKDLFALTEMTATQFLASWLGFFGGLINTTSGDANEYAGFLRSNASFQNVSLLVNPVSMRIVPSITLGGGVVLIPFDWLVGTLAVMGTEESAGSDPFDTNDGVTFVTEWTLSHPVGPLSVRHVAGFGIGFDNDFFRLGELPRLELPPDAPPRLRFSTKDESWAFWYNGQLDLWVDEADDERRAGLFFRFGYADDETNFIQWDLAAGIGGMGVFDLRPRDRFGIGVYHLEPSNEFPLPQFGVGEETGVEMFYNAEILKGVNLTADLQYIDPSFGSGLLVTTTPDKAWIAGLRLRIML
jgi:porin